MRRWVLVVPLMVLVVLLAGCAFGRSEQDEADLSLAGSTVPEPGSTTISLLSEPVAPSTTPASAGSMSGLGSPETPIGVLATQGPLASAFRYVLLTWDHVAEPGSTYDVERDGDVVAAVKVDAESWDDAAWKDEAVEPGDHQYRVRSNPASGQPGPWSAPAAIHVRDSADLQRVYDVDSYTGTDLDKAQQAVDDAADAGGGLVVFGPRTYVFTDPLVVYGNGVLLQGAGREETTIKVGFEGGTESCGRVTPLIQFRGDLREQGALTTTTSPAGTTHFELDRPVAISIGDTVALDGVVGQWPTGAYEEAGIAQDPAGANDQRYPFDIGVVVGIDGNVIELDHPLTPIITEGSELYRYEIGFGNGLELMTLEGLSASDTSYHRLLDIADQVQFRVADVTARWANRNFVEASGYQITLIGFEGVEGGAGGYELEACKYKVGFAAAADIVVVGSTFGSEEHDLNMSLMTVQFVNRVLVRHSTFGGSKTYGFNEHGGGSRMLVFENNRVSSGPNGWAGILLGNDTWGFGGETAIRNNEFVDNPVDVLMEEHPYGVVIVGNRSVGCTEACITWAGWGGEWDGYRPIEDEALWGSARLLISGNLMTSKGDGIVLGLEDSSGYWYEGIRDLVVSNNVIEAEGADLRLLGGPESTGRIWIMDNQTSSDMKHEMPGDDWVWSGNGDQLSVGDLASVPSWANRYLEWER